MDIKIKVKASPGEVGEKVFVFSLRSDFGCSETEWERLSQEQKKTLIQTELDNSPDQPYWQYEEHSLPYAK